jgi:hypothetical protein
MRYSELKESKYFPVEIRGTRLDVIKNPNHNDILRLFAAIRKYLRNSNPKLNEEARGLLFDDGDLYVWNAYEASHDQIAGALKLYDFCDNLYFSSPTTVTASHDSEIQRKMDSPKFDNLRIALGVRANVLKEYQKMEIATIPGKIYKKSVPVWINPSRKELDKLIGKFKIGKSYNKDDGYARGIVDTKGNIFVWDSYEAEHNQIIRNMGIDPLYLFYIIDTTPTGILVYDLYNDLVPLEKISFPHFKEICKGKLSESIEILPISYGPHQKKDITVWKNEPNLEAIMKKTGNSVRGIVDSQGNLYVWDEYDATHFEIKEVLEKGGAITEEDLWNENNGIKIYCARDKQYYVAPNGVYGQHTFDDPKVPEFIRNALVKIKKPKITEGKVEFVSIKGITTKVLKNPSNTELLNLINNIEVFKNTGIGKIKGIIDNKKDLYVWDAYLAHHNQIKFMLALNVQCNVYIEYYSKENNFVYNAFRKEYDAPKNAIVFPSFRKALNLQKLAEGRLEDFKKLADDQRYRPELAMLDAQKVLHNYPNGASLGYALEHVGDLTHRMSQRFCERMGYGEEWVAPKVKIGLQYLKNIPDTEAAMAIPDLPELKTYATEHAKLKVYNAVQKAARDAAVALGYRKFNLARKNLEYLQGLIDSGKYQEEAAKYELTETAQPFYRGFWITDKGEILNCDYENDIHHADLLVNYFKIKQHRDKDNDINWDEYYGNTDLALKHGWVRCSISGNKLNIQMVGPLSKAADHCLLDWVSKYGKMFGGLFIENPYTKETTKYFDRNKFYSEIKKRISGRKADEVN